MSESVKKKKAVSAPHTPLYGAFLSLSGKSVLVVGGGAVAARKVEHLLSCGACVTVVSPEFDDALATLESATLIKRRYVSGDLKGQRLVFAATDNAVLNASICEAAERKGIWSNCAAPPDAGTFAVPATVNRGMFSLAVSTGGSSPAMSAYWRKRLEKIAGPEWGELAALQLRMRALAHEKIDDAERRRGVLMRLGAAHWARKVKMLGTEAVEALMTNLVDELPKRSKSRARK